MERIYTYLKSILNRSRYKAQPHAKSAASGIEMSQGIDLANLEFADDSLLVL